MRIRDLVAFGFVTANGQLVTAQTGPAGGWLVEVIGGRVTPQNPSATIRVSAYFPSHFQAFHAGRLDLIGTDQSAVFSDFMIPAPLGPRPPGGGYGCFGMIVGGTVPGGVERISFAQLGIVGCLPHPANPLPIFEAQWTTDDFTPRVVDIETRNTDVFRVWVDTNGNWIDLIPINQFHHGSAVIQVIPTPGGAAVLLGAGLAVWRRRRMR